MDMTMTKLSYRDLERRIERIIELEYDQLDKQLMRGDIDQDQYHEEAREIDKWAREMYYDLEMKGVY
jgi:hypothetical protein